MAASKESVLLRDVFDDFFEEQVLGDQHLLVEEAEGLRESSDSESDAVVEPSAWWARLVQQHASTMPVQGRQLNLLSGCRGLCAEAEVLKDTSRFLLVFLQVARP